MHVVEIVERLVGAFVFELLLVEYVHEQMEELVTVVLLGLQAPIVSAERSLHPLCRIELVVIDGVCRPLIHILVIDVVVVIPDVGLR